ncbi:MAG: hypothetical protein FWG35_03880 [Spirochaetaceae bacterium]|nr:hypothetical protein [Spirochaetaceae bacterium]
MKVPKDRKKIFLIGIAAGAFFCFFIVLAVVILYEPPRPYDLPILADEGPHIPRISAYDFALPDEVDRFLSPRPEYFREPGAPWTEKDSRGFWVDPRELAASVLKRQNRNKLDDILRKVP